MNLSTYPYSVYSHTARIAATIAVSCALIHTPFGFAQSLSTNRATELRVDKLAAAPVLTSLPAGAAVRMLSLEGGWAWVEASGQQGWVRASSLNLQAGSSTAAAIDSGRQATSANGNTLNAALTLGVRSLPPRINRHALIIGVGNYADPAVPPLPGTKIDKDSATQMAAVMQVPQSNIVYLQDAQATGDSIRKALADLNSKVQEGDRVFVHFSGHGTRYPDPQNGGCVEALLAYDGGQKGTLTNREMSDLLKPITEKTDKLFVMYDACHSGGIVNAASPLRSRGFSNPNDEGILRPKFSNISEECGRPVNIKTRNLVVEQVSKGALPQDVIHISASRHDEISFDDGEKGGLATQYMRDCMLREARDLDGSGAISMDEIRQCAQRKINDRMRNDAQYKPHSIQLSGNTGFIPAWFSQALPGAQTIASLAPVAPVPLVAPHATVATAPPPKPPVVATPANTQTASKPPAVAVAAPVPAAIPTPAPVIVAPPPPAPVAASPVAPLTGEQALRQMFDQRDAKRKVSVALSKPRLKIGEDVLELSVNSDRTGYVYVALVGSDSKSMYMLFPNDLDQNNRIEAGKPMSLPRPNWRVKAGGPVGIDHLLVMVADSPRDLTLLGNKAGPFVSALNTTQGRADLGVLMSSSRLVTSQECTNTNSRNNNPLCSDAYGAAMASVEEIK
jgi:Caspase domain/Domain of unknown function (DUF4384)